MTVSIWWIRRDLRLAGSRALDAALADGAELIPLFILDPALFPGCPQPRRDFLLEGLRSLDQDLRRKGSGLVVRSGRPLEVLRDVLGEGGGGRIYAEEDYSPYAVRRDRRAAAELPVTFFKGNLRVPPGGLLSGSGSPYRVFTPFARAWRALPMAAVGGRPFPEGHIAALMRGEEIPASIKPCTFPAGEKEALDRLRKFTAGEIYHYAVVRDRPDLEGTSKLSPYLRFGMLSAEMAVQAGLEAEKVAPDRSAAISAFTWVNELAWREFFMHVLYHNPWVIRRSYRLELQALPWRKAPGELEAWKYGQTGCPIVDAGMRQMLATGWMHNRLRMITASFLVKDLLIDWREGERWFAEKLADYDPAANNGGWQWTAGTGTDAAPFFRIFNPVLQAKKFDPQGAYVRRWVPETAGLPGNIVHEPWKLPAGSQPKGYPGLLIDHGFARERTLRAYQGARQKAGA